MFARINELKPALRERAKTILGWIECAPVPMTRQEMEQALLVSPGSSEAPSVVASVNFVAICGPILETVGEKLQFVHFTVKEHVSPFVIIQNPRHGCKPWRWRYLNLDANKLVGTYLVNTSLVSSTKQKPIAALQTLHWPIYAPEYLMWSFLVKSCRKTSSRGGIGFSGLQRITGSPFFDAA